MDDEKLIECVREYEAIYDMTHPKYLDSNHKAFLWKTIAEEMDEQDTVCKKRWINIRDQFRKSLNKRKAASGHGADTSKKKYKYEETLQFLMPHMLDRSTVTNLDVPTENSEHSFDELDSQSSLAVDEAHIVHVVNTNVEAHLSEPPSKQRKKRSSIEGTSVIPMKFLAGNQFQPEIGLEKHPIDAFLEGLAPILKNLPPYYQHLARGKIFSVVQDMEAAAFYSSHPLVPGTSHSSNSIGRNQP